MHAAHDAATSAQGNEASLRAESDRKHAGTLVAEKDSRDALLVSQPFSRGLAGVPTKILSSLRPLCGPFGLLGACVTAETSALQV